MENQSIFNECTNLYSLSKTFRFELVPVGETLNHIKEKGLLSQDKQRSKDYERFNANTKSTGKTTKIRW